MKITVKQLKQIIREQVEEAGGWWGAPPVGGGIDKSLPDQREREENMRKYHEQESKKARDRADADELAANTREYNRRQALKDAEEWTRRQEEEAEAEKEYERSGQYEEMFQTTGKDPKKVAVKFWSLPKETQQKVMMSRAYRMYNIGDAIRKHTKNYTPKGRRTDNDTGKSYYVKGVDKTPGMFGLGFMGLEEDIQQMVKEEVARQLRNKR